MTSNEMKKHSSLDKNDADSCKLEDRTTHVYLIIYDLYNIARIVAVLFPVDRERKMKKRKRYEQEEGRKERKSPRGDEK